MAGVAAAGSEQLAVVIAPALFRPARATDGERLDGKFALNGQDKE